MTVYSYKATDKSGKFIEGDIDVPDYQAAIEHIRQLNYFPVKVAEGKSASKISAGMKTLRTSTPTSTRERTSDTRWYRSQRN